MNFLKVKKDSFSLVSAILFLILGIILIMDSATVISCIIYILGGILVLLGLIKLFMYFKKKALEPDNYSNLAAGIALIILGVVIMFCSEIIEFVLKVLIGGFLLYGGIIKLMLAFKLKGMKFDNWYVTLISSIIMMACGLYSIIVSNIIANGAGIILVVYSIIEIVQYIIVPKDKNPDIIK